jgi:hypothetical protein
MRAVSEITVLGPDNVLLDVGDLEAAKGFYGGRLGLGVKFDFPDAGVVGFRLGDEALAAAGTALLGEPREPRTGWVVEVADPWGNVVGRTDYLLAPELARQREAGQPHR